MLSPDIDLETLARTPPDVRIGYVLTQEGRVWSETGILYATDLVNRHYPPPENASPDSGILWHMGAQINEPALLAKFLRSRPDAFVILFLPDGTALLPNCTHQENLVFAGYLDDNTDRTSWAVLTELYRTSASQTH